jgi:hypothetical protein
MSAAPVQTPPKPPCRRQHKLASVTSASDPCRLCWRQRHRPVPSPKTMVRSRRRRRAMHTLHRRRRRRCAAREQGCRRYYCCRRGSERCVVANCKQTRCRRKRCQASNSVSPNGNTVDATSTMFTACKGADYRPGPAANAVISTWAARGGVVCALFLLVFATTAQRVETVPLSRTSCDEWSARVQRTSCLCCHPELCRNR